MWGEEEETLQSSVTVIVELLQLMDVKFTFSPRVKGKGQPARGTSITLENSPYDIAEILILCSKWGKKCIQFRVWPISKQQMQFRIFSCAVRNEPCKLHLTSDSFCYFARYKNETLGNAKTPIHQI